jgi:hypothetical protein
MGFIPRAAAATSQYPSLLMVLANTRHFGINFIMIIKMMVFPQKKPPN